MKKAWLSFVLTAVVGVSLAAGWETAAEPQLYGVAFEDYDEGERLSDKGAVGGTWVNVSNEVTAAALVGGRKCMTCELANLLFRPEWPGLDGPKDAKASVFLTGSPRLPDLSNRLDKAAIAIRVPDQGVSGSPVFAGWTGVKWCDLYSSVAPVTNSWYDVSVWFSISLNRTRQVQYRIKVGDAYVPLHAADGSEWLDSGIMDSGENEEDAVVREVEVRGTGAFDLLSGRELPSPGISVRCK